MDKKLQIDSVEQMIALGRRLGVGAQAGDVIVLVGDLGAGKTHMSKGIAAGLGSSAELSSPTFNIVLEYHDGRMPLYHLDFYRLEQEEDLEDVGYYEMLEGVGCQLGLTVIEWGDKFPDALPQDYLLIELSRLSHTQRALSARASGPASQRLLEAI